MYKTKSINFFTLIRFSSLCSPLSQYRLISNYLASQDSYLCLILDFSLSFNNPPMQLVFKCWLLHTPMYSLLHLRQFTSYTSPPQTTIIFHMDHANTVHLTSLLSTCPLQSQTLQCTINYSTAQISWCHASLSSVSFGLQISQDNFQTLLMIWFLFISLQSYYTTSVSSYLPYKLNILILQGSMFPLHSGPLWRWWSLQGTLFSFVPTTCLTLIPPQVIYLNFTSTKKKNFTSEVWVKQFSLTYISYSSAFLCLTKNLIPLLYDQCLACNKFLKDAQRVN